MLKQRILTALVLVPLVVAAVLYLPSWAVSVVVGLIVALGVLEYARLGHIGRDWWLWGCLLATLLLLLIAYRVLENPMIIGVIVITALGWLGMTGVVFWGRPDVALEPRTRPMVLLTGAFVLFVTWLSLVRLHRMEETGPELVMFLLVLIWSADTGAYFAGKRWGKHKLAPAISPGKTREGMYGALAAAAACAGLFAALGLIENVGFPTAFALCGVTTIVSIAGDLWESVHKRRRGVKDSGQLLPGHGGILDRIDSLIAASPVFAGGVWLLKGSL